MRRNELLAGGIVIFGALTTLAACESQPPSSPWSEGTGRDGRPTLHLPADDGDPFGGASCGPFLEKETFADVIIKGEIGGALILQAGARAVVERKGDILVDLPLMEAAASGRLSSTIYGPNTTACVFVGVDPQKTTIPEFKYPLPPTRTPEPQALRKAGNIFAFRTIGKPQSYHAPRRRV